ncbi:MAG: YybH family protein [Acidobacteriota bacterium]
MRNHCLLLIAVAMLIVNACGPPPEPPIDIEAERAALREAADAYHEAGAAVDVETIVSLYASDALILPPNGEKVQGMEGIRNFFSAFAAMPGFQVRFETPKVEVSSAGDLGYTLTDAELTVEGPDGEPVTDRLRDFHLWKKQDDGSWKVVVDIWNSENPLPTEGE